MSPHVARELTPWQGRKTDRLGCHNKKSGRILGLQNVLLIPDTIYQHEHIGRRCPFSLGLMGFIAPKLCLVSVQNRCFDCNFVQPPLSWRGVQPTVLFVVRLLYLFTVVILNRGRKELAIGLAPKQSGNFNNETQPRLLHQEIYAILLLMLFSLQGFIQPILSAQWGLMPLYSEG